MVSTVLLTTSGLGTRLEGFTQYTNKALVPLGDQYAICRIIERFPVTTRFVVTLGYYGAHVRDFLELAYPDRAFVFVDVDPYEGAGSSQAYSMLCAEEHLQEPFLYHCCDTILPPGYRMPMSELSESTAPVTLFVATHPDYSSYSGITVRGGGEGPIVRFNAKREAIHDYAYIGISYIGAPALFWKALRACVDAGGGEGSAGSLGDTDAYRLLLKGFHGLDYEVVPAFYDTGNVDSYRHACKAFPGGPVILAKSNESLCFLRDAQGNLDRVIKFLHSATTNARRVQRGHLLESRGGPRILGSRPNFLLMSYEEGELLSECREDGEVVRFLTWANQMLWTPTRSDASFLDVCHRFYYVKTRERLRLYAAKRPEDLTVVNGVRVGTIEEVLARVDWIGLYTDTFAYYHGDCIFDNLLRRTDGSYCLLDWRDSFDSEVEYGDPAYDLAKLRHNLVFQHANIANGGFSVVRNEKGDGVFVDLDCKYRLVRQLEELDAWVLGQGWNVENIRILQALIWLNMAPLYEAPLCDFLYYFGKWNLWLHTR